MHFTTIDTATINDKKFFAIAGTGYDAEIASKFAVAKTRGFFTYLRLSVVNFFTYKPAEYIVSVDGKEHKKIAFLISVANSSEYGNNAYIAPEASLLNGTLDVCMLKPYNMFVGPFLALKLFNRTLHKSSYLQIIRGKVIEIKRTDNNPMCIHYDGEVMQPANPMHIEIKPKTLKVIYPQGKAI